MKEEINKLYDYNIEKFRRIRDEVIFIVESIFEKTDIKIHNVHSRIKKIDSLIKKAEGVDLENANQIFEKIQDIVGIRIICLFVSDISEIIKLLRENFTVIQEDNKISESEISSFGYFSVHFYCKLKKDFKGTRYDDIKDIGFEIQVRTISMDAWANISHYLDYKSELEIPKELKKDFFALSGLFYVADTHFEMFFKNKKEQSKIAKEDVEKNIDVEINFETLEAYINNRFKKRQKAWPEHISKMTQELIQVGYKKISDLDKKLDEAFKIVPDAKQMRTLNRIGIVRMSLKISDPEYLKLWEAERDQGLNRNKKRE
ncbi:MAG: hypothetical protein QM737_18630 [Ferruginibacter sp.]